MHHLKIEVSIKSMTISNSKIYDSEEKISVINQRLSVIVRARLLFQREVEIDRGSGNPKFDQEYFSRLIESKKAIDVQMVRMLISAAAFTLLFYLVGKGMSPDVPLWSVKLSSVPGILTFLALLSGYTVSMAAYAFFNSQAYVALIDQFILLDSQHGIIDVDMVKASHEQEWLIFKILRQDFSLYAPVHISFGWLGRFLSQLTFFLMIVVAIMPFFALLLAVPYLTATLLENDLIGLATQGFVYLCVASVVLLLVISNLGFTCEVRLLDQE